MDEVRTEREFQHELGNLLQERVALQYLLVLTAEQIEQLAAGVSDEAEKQKALEAVERFRRAAEL